MIQKIGQFCFASACSQIHFVSNEYDGHLLVNFANSWHPVCLEPLDAFEVIYIVYQNDDVGLFDLNVIILLFLFTGWRVNQLRIHLVWQKIVIRRYGNWMIGFLHLARKIVGYECDDD